MLEPQEEVRGTTSYFCLTTVTSYIYMRMCPASFLKPLH